MEAHTVDGGPEPQRVANIKVSNKTSCDYKSPYFMCTNVIF